MKKLMPLRKMVVDVTHEASRGDDQEIRKAVRSWHNRLGSGSIPRKVVMKLGRELFVDLDEWELWLETRKNPRSEGKIGRPRNAN
jgi:hypothetical protein